MKGHLLSLALSSARNRRFSLSVTVIALALSVLLMLSVERLRSEARSSFMQSVSGTDLIVGPRSSPVQLMLYAVFRLGSANNTLSWKSLQMVRSRADVAFAIPLSLGDSHDGFAVLGTDLTYFEHFRFGNRQALSFAQGTRFADTLDGLFEAVVGTEVAQHDNLSLGSQIELNHGGGNSAHAQHNERPFNVVGILAATGTPVDRTVHVSLAAIEALHVDWVGGARMPGIKLPADQLRKFDLQPKMISAVLVGLTSRSSVFAMQRALNTYEGEPLTAVMPALALDELWKMLAVLENTLRLVSMLVFAVSVLGLVAIMLATLNERRREMAILRSVGASPGSIFMLLAIEAFAVVVLASVAGVGLLYMAVVLAAPLIAERFGVLLRPQLLSPAEWLMLAAILLVGLAASIAPATRAYRLSLADGLSPRL